MTNNTAHKIQEIQKNQKFWFKSKRNYVYLENNRVYKSLVSREAALAEADILRKLYTAGVNVPQIVSAGIDGEITDGEIEMIVMEYIEGETLTDIIERENKPPEPLAERISEWFAAFYEVFPDRTRGDVNCRNFIITQDMRVFSVDFEDLPLGRKETDLGRMRAFILNYDPAYTEYKKSLAQALTNCFETRFGIDSELADMEQNLEIQQMQKRRAKNI